MARLGKKENQVQSKTAGGQANASYKAGQKDLDTYRTNITTLEHGGNVGADPFKDPEYLGNEAKLQAGVLSSENSAASNQLSAVARKQGGLGAGAIGRNIGSLALQKMRLADNLTADRAAGDYKANLGWQQYLAGAPLASSQAEQGYFSTAEGGESSANKNLTDLGVAAYGPWIAAIHAAGQAASAGLTAGLAPQPPAAGPGCWIAEAIYGVTDPRTTLLRAYLNGPFRKHQVGDMVMRFYLRFGERIAQFARRYRVVRWALRPLFELGLKAAEGHHDR